ncbi:Alpha/Beta hydrolase protein [Penicillium hispanicum]|uniref:Alpha/Beta hydrolase protein n=1 Tax=Penicillium hispanicum TaxID=1080232 RepID=UPI0025413C24|nr:Alpha/Beta hydrolase protein [Penicillium hispanicum]KAJ5578807.1 Alpha/Beta hydrolase protein [Penicillium hispanicum]
MSSIAPFKINISEERVQRLHQKLALTDFPDEISDLGSDELWSRGVPLAEVKRLTAYWQDGFDWRKTEDALNEFPQYTADINIGGFGNYQIHFVHQTSDVVGAIPLLFLHGWPGSFIEVTKLLPLLANGGESGPCFHVIAPSLIDFGFSTASKMKSFGVDQHAEAYHKLMLALGYEEYVIQAGDVGYLIARSIASKYGSKNCKAIHTNSAVPAEPNAELHSEVYAKVQSIPLSDSDKEGLVRTASVSKDGMGYYQQLSTRPQTIGYGLTDSPVGLLAWLHEKLHGWTDAYPWTDDEILTWVSIHYFSTAGATAPGYVYYMMEHSSPSAFVASQKYIAVPMGIARFARDLILLPKPWNQTLGPIVYESEHQKGGHFAAWECPEEIVRDLRAMFGKGGPLSGCVDGKMDFEGL